MSATRMKPRVKTYWLSALRSGEFIQGRSRLRSEDKKQHCCLGVLTALYLREHPEDTNTADQLNRGSTLSQAVMDWAELFRTNPPVQSLVNANYRTNLGSLNDDGADFAEIAQVIEEQL